MLARNEPAYEVMFLSWSLVRRQKPIFCNTLILTFKLMYLPEIGEVNQVAHRCTLNLCQHFTFFHEV